MTLQAMGITDALYRTLRTTNPNENLNGSVAHYSRNLHRSKDASMIMRTAARALSGASGRFRKLRGIGEMKSLLKALDDRAPW